MSSTSAIVATSRPIPAFTQRQIVRASVFIASHVVLAILMRATPMIATAHALATVVGGLFIAATTRRIRRVSTIVAYIAGCEVLWRMTRAAVPWELGKFGLVAILLVALARINARRNRALSITYFALLVPSIALTFMALDLDSARQEVSFNLSGPLALAVAVIFFSNIRLTAFELRTTFLALIAPVVGVGALSYLSTVSRDALVFVNASNVDTSGGFGPNQVSAVLGLAVLFLVLLSFDRQVSWRWRIPILTIATALAAQTALTFARGGLVLAFAAIAAALFFLLKENRRGRATVIVVALSSFAVGEWLIEPRLDDFTEGRLSARYSSTKSSGRTDYVVSEIMMFGENPVLGVGPGVGMHLRDELELFSGSSHTEYTRMLAEHGVLGALALCCLVVLAFRAIRDARDAVARSTASALVTWTALFLLINGTRIVAPAFVFGLAFAVPLAREASSKLKATRR